MTPNLVIILAEDVFRDEELIYPYYRFKEAGYTVKIVGPEKGRQYRGKFGLPVESDMEPSEVKITEVAAVIIPGGFAPDKMRTNKEMVKLVKDAYENCRIIGAICHGGWMLVEADVIRGKDVTGYKAIATDLINAGGNYLDREIVIDKNIVTSRIPDDLPIFCRDLLELLKAYYK
jgi:protease I